MLREVLQRVKRVPRIEVFVILAMRALHLAVMPRRIGTYFLMLNAIYLKLLLKQSQVTFFRLGKSFRELRPVIRLDFQDREREILHEFFQEHHGGIGALLLKGAQVTHPGVLVDGGVLVQLSSVLCVLPGKAGTRDNFDIDLHFFAGSCGVVVRLGLVFFLGVLEFCGMRADPFHALVQAGDGTALAFAAQFDPKHDKAVVRIAPLRVFYERNLLFCVLVWMGVWTSGLRPEGFGGSVVTLAQAVDELAVGTIFDSGLCNAVLFGVGKNC